MNLHRRNVGLDILAFILIPGTSMNRARSLASALLSGMLYNLWLYWTATFIVSSIVALISRNEFLIKKV